MKYLFVIIILTVFLTDSIIGQSSVNKVNPSYRYFSNPGFVNITEINGAIGLGDTSVINSKYYFGVTNVFGYQINRNFFGGVGVGCYFFESRQLIPIYFDYRYSAYLKSLTPSFFADGGLLLDPVDLNYGTKLFINPGIGINRSVSPKLECTLAAGLMVQMGNSLPRTSFVNFKLGIIYRQNSFRLYKQEKISNIKHKELIH
jgi:hypothetical protein